MSDVARAFAARFGRAPTAITDAPGRVNLLGEHTDYNDGFVLPMAIPQRTFVAVARRDDSRVRVVSENVHEGEKSYQLGSEAKRGDFVDRVQAVTFVLTRDGKRLSGFDLLLDSEVPIGSGLSSSAALSVAVLRALRAAFELPIDDLAVARLGHRAETDFVGAPVGILDPMACSLGDERHALFLDTRSLAYERVPLPNDVELVIVDSGIAHSNAGGDYRVRRAECTRAAEMLGVRALRDLGEDALARAATLPIPLSSRVRHVVTENARVHEGVAAMKRGDARALGRAFVASHRSMRDDYQVSLPEIDALVDIACQDESVFGARLTGGGFGGAIVALARSGQGRGAGERIVERYRTATGREGRLLVPS